MMQPPVPSAMTRLDDERRRNFVSATLSVLADNGYVGTTLARIAERAEVSPSLLVHYFGDKDTLLATAFWHLSESLRHEIMSRFQAAHTPRERLQAVIDSCSVATSFDRRRARPGYLSGDRFLMYRR